MFRRLANTGLSRINVHKPVLKGYIRSITDVVSGSSVGQGVEDRTFVTGYGDHAFQVNDCLVRDSVVLLPESYFIWKARTFEEITLDSLSVFTALFPTIEMVIIGCGERVPAMLDPKIVTEMRNKGIVVELMNSSSALTTFNVLNSEGRNVGAAIIPIKGYDPLQGQDAEELKLE